MRPLAFLIRDRTEREGERKRKVCVKPGTPKRRGRGKSLIHTRETNKEAGNVEHVGGEARLVVVHVVLLARLIPHDID